MATGRNLELKAFDPEPERSLRICLEIAADQGLLQQRDTYFEVAHGRLKLREQTRTAQLIHYEWEDRPDSKTSRYQLTEVGDPKALPPCSPPR